MGMRIKSGLWSTGAAVVALVLGSGAVQAADSLSAEDRQKGIQELKRTREAFVAATSGLSETQWKYKPAPDRWSIAEIAEHIAVTEGFLLQNVTQNVMKAPAGAADRDYRKTDAFVLAAIADRSQKAKAPEPVVPKGVTLQEAVDKFLAARAQTIQIMGETQGLRDHVVESPIRQPLDGYQWLLFISAHTTRHLAQMAEVKADAGYPGR